MLTSYSLEPKNPVMSLDTNFSLMKWQSPQYVWSSHERQD